MKLVRLWLVICLALLLPVRGAVAATMGCAPPAAPLHAHGHHARPAAQAVGDHQQHAAGHGSRCVCGALCSGTPLPSSLPMLPPALPRAAAAFAEPVTALPSFVAGGLERPPRST